MSTARSRRAFRPTSAFLDGNELGGRMVNQRDDFSEETKRILAMRVGTLCSFPGCGRPTKGPNADKVTKAVSLGIACHLAAASPGGPRYDESMTRAQRKAIENGIWLCLDHAGLIDKDDSSYTVEELRQWRRDAEARAAERLRSGTAAALVASRLYGVPRTPSAAFVGRAEEIAQLRDVLNHSSAVRIAASVEGLPGIGKTELALQLVYQLAHDGTFPGGIFWFDAEDPDLVPTWGGTIANDLGIPEGPVDQRAAASMQWVDEHQEPTLLVFDNVESWSGEAKPQPFPRGAHVRYLVTTRQRRLGGSAFDKHVEVGFLDNTFALELLERLAGRALADAPGLTELVEHLGGHALAVELAGAFLGVYSNETPASYLAELKANSDEVEGEIADDVRYRRTVSQAFATLWDRLDDSVRQAWQLAACFEPEPVAQELSEAVGLSRKSRRQLQRLHLIEVDGEDRWWMHRLTREFGRKAGAEEGRQAAVEAFVNGCAIFADPIELSDGFRIYRPNRAHLDAALAAAPEVLDGEDLSRMQDRIGTALQSGGELIPARRLLEQALASDLEHLGENHPSVATRRSNLSGVLRDLGDLPGARLLLEQALASSLLHFGEEHLKVATARNNLAEVLLDQGDYSNARALLEQALASDLKRESDDHPLVATSRSNLAVVLHALGDLSGARDLLKQALSSGLEHLGEEHPTVAARRSNLALVLQALGDLSGARDLLEQALSSGLQHLGEDHPSVATLRSNLAVVLQALGDLSGARDLLQRALSSDLEHLGEDHPTVATLRSNLAVVLQALGDFSGARDLLEQALANGLERFGKDHPEVAARRSNLALVLQALGDLSGARDLLEQVLSSGLEHLGEDHPEVATRRSNLALVLQALGDLSGARDLLEQALSSGLERFGEDHPEVATRRSNLAMVRKDLGDFSGARDLLEQALSRALEHLGEDHPLVATVRSNLAVVLQALGDLDGARGLLEQALASGLEHLGEDHPEVAIRRTNLGAMLQILGHLDEARILLEMALATFIAKLGEEHPDVANCRAHLDHVLANLENSNPE